MMIICLYDHSNNHWKNIDWYCYIIIDSIVLIIVLAISYNIMFSILLLHDWLLISIDKNWNIIYYFQGGICFIFRKTLSIQRQMHTRGKYDHADYCTQNLLPTN